MILACIGSLLSAAGRGFGRFNPRRTNEAARAAIGTLSEREPDRDGDWLNPAEGNASYEIELRRSFEFQKNGLCLWSRIIDMPTKMSMFFIDCEIASLL